MKSTTSISIDSDVLSECRIRQIPLSYICNEALKAQLNLMEKKLPNTKEKIQKELVDTTSMMVKLRREIEKIDEKEQREAIARDDRIH